MAKGGRKPNADADLGYVQVIRRLMFEQRVSGSEVSAAVPMQRQAFSAIMQGRSDPHLSTLQGIARALKVPLYALFVPPEPAPAPRKDEDDDVLNTLVSLAKLLRR